MYTATGMTVVSYQSFCEGKGVSVAGTELDNHCCCGYELAGGGILSLNCGRMA